MAWFYYALATSVCWGLGYAVLQKLLHAGLSPSVVTLFIVVLSVPAYLAIGLYTGSLKESIAILDANKSLLYISIAMAGIFVFGNLFIMMSIQMKNATYANIIEITYPIFTILFTWLILKEFHLNWSTAFGTVLILSGVALILYKS